MLEGAFTVSWKVLDPLPACPVASTTFTVNVCAPVVMLVGVPVIFPVLSIANPSAIRPVQLNVSGAVPPVAVIGINGLLVGSIALPLVRVKLDGIDCVSLIAAEYMTIPTDWLLPMLLGVSSVTVIV
jgi:xanthosine utilization system XapX-like protein